MAFAQTIAYVADAAPTVQFPTLIFLPLEFHSQVPFLIVS